MAKRNPSSGWPAAAGEMAERIRAHDWATTPLGPIEAWPQSLRTAVDLLLPIGFPMAALWGPDLVQIYNDAYRNVMGVRHPAGLGQTARACWPEVWHINQPIFERAQAGETITIENGRYPVVRGGTLEDAWFTVSYSPLCNEAGAVAGALVTFVETTESVQSLQRLNESEERFRALVEGWAQAVWETDPSGAATQDSPSWRAYTGQEKDRLFGHGWLEMIHPDDRAEVERQWCAAVAAVSTFDAEYRLRRADGGWQWTNVRAAPLLTADGRVRKWVGMNIDISARRKAEETQQVLIAELQHRTRNLLALVHSISGKTIDASTSLDDYEAQFNRRLSALSRVQAILSRSEGHRACVHEIVEAELQALGAGKRSDRVSMSGPSVPVDSKAVQILMLVIHELATNAAKYGALAQEPAKLKIEWSTDVAVDREVLRLLWCETGVTLDVAALSAKRGFGRELIENALPYDLGAETRWELTEQGVRCEMTLPLDRPDASSE